MLLFFKKEMRMSFYDMMILQIHMMIVLYLNGLLQLSVLHHLNDFLHLIFLLHLMLLDIFYCSKQYFHPNFALSLFHNLNYYFFHILHNRYLYKFLIKYKEISSNHIKYFLIHLNLYFYINY